MTRPTRLSVSSFWTGVRGSRRFLPPPRRRRGGGIQAPCSWKRDFARETPFRVRFVSSGDSSRRGVPRRAARRARELPGPAGVHGTRNDYKCYRVRNGRRRSRIYLGLRHQPRPPRVTARGPLSLVPSSAAKRSPACDEKAVFSFRRPVAPFLPRDVLSCASRTNSRRLSSG
jgi:hypothetical protein